MGKLPNSKITVRTDLYLTECPKKSFTRYDGDNMVAFEVKVKRIRVDGNELFYDDDGKLHRDNGPAFVQKGCKPKWYKHGEQL